MIAHIDLDAFFASIEQRDHPELVDKPVVVGFVTPQGKFCNRGVVSAASYEARHYGVSSGMSLWQAKMLCPHLIIISGNFGKYEDASCQMYQIISCYSPDIEPLSLDEAFISFNECKYLYHNLLAVCRNIKEEIKSKIGITASIGLASNKVVAKIASDFKKPDGLTVIPAGKEKRFLKPLPINRLYGVGPATKDRLTALEIRTVGQMANLNKNFLKSLFGKYGETLWYFANGISESSLSQPELAKSIGRSITFPWNSSNVNYLWQNLTLLSEKVAGAMRHEKVLGGCITLTLRDKKFRTWSHQKSLQSKIVAAFEIKNLAKTLLNEAWDFKTPLRLLGITLSSLSTNLGQLSLVENFDKMQKLTGGIDTIRAKFGFWKAIPTSILGLKPSTETFHISV